MAKKLRWLSVASLLVPSVGLAALGGSAEPVQTDRLQKAMSRKGPAASYSLNEFQIPSGTVVREYVSPHGKVFAVVWRGPSQPNLQQVLGTHFGAYTDAAKARHAGHGQLAIRQPDLVVQSSGRMRAFFGKAYLPELLPQGVSVEEIQ